MLDASPFLYIGITFAIFSLSGKYPEDKEELIMLVIGVRILHIVVLISFVEMPSGPELDLLFRQRLIFNISCSLVGDS